MVSSLGSLVQFSPAAGRAGAADRCRCVWGALAEFRPHWVCPVQGCLCFPRLHCSGSRLLYMEWALRWVRFQFSGSPQKRGFGCACILSLPWTERVQAARGLGALSPAAVRLFPPRPQRAPPVGSQEVFRQDPGPVCRVGGGGFSGAEFAPFPLPLPPTSSADGPALLWSFSVPLFCERPAVCSAG